MVSAGAPWTEALVLDAAVPGPVVGTFAAGLPQLLSPILHVIHGLIKANRATKSGEKKHFSKTVTKIASSLTRF